MLTRLSGIKSLLSAKMELVQVQSSATCLTGLREGRGLSLPDQLKSKGQIWET